MSKEEGKESKVLEKGKPGGEPGSVPSYMSSFFLKDLDTGSS